jgi:outer membrane cobalamin receptor
MNSRCGFRRLRSWNRGRIPFGSVSRIEITTGGGYNSRGLAGSVNFITSHKSDNPTISTGAQRGSFDREQYSARISGISFLKTVFSLDSENIFDRGDFSFTDPRDSARIRENNYYHDRKLFGVLKHRYGQSSLEFSARFFGRSSGSAGPIFQVTPEAHSVMSERELALELSSDISSKGRITLTGGSTNREIEYDSPRTIYNFIAYHSTFKENSRDIEARYQYKGSFDFDFSGVLRYESLDGEDHIRPETSFGLHSRMTNSVKGGMTYHLPKFNGIKNISAISLGLRREGGEGGDFDAPAITFRSGFDIFASPGFDISYSRSRRLPDMTDLFWKEDVFAAPNPDLKPEISGGYDEIGADLEFKGVLPTKLRAVRHSREYEDLIIWRRWAGNRYKPVNLSAAEISGWELSFESSPLSGPLTVFWTGSFNKPLNKESEINHYDKYLIFRPIGTQTAGIQFDYYGLEIKLAGRHIGERYQTEENTKSLPPVDLVDIRLDYSRSLWKFDITAGIDLLNVGDKEYQILDRQPERPREYRFNLKIRYKGGLL